MRWEAPDGSVWASRFEYEVYRGLKESGVAVRRTDEQDRLFYSRPIRKGTCAACGSSNVVSRHSYCPDLFVSTQQPDERRSGQSAAVPAAGYYIEAKGFFRADRRSLLRSLRKARPDVDLRLVVQRDYRITKRGLSLVQWIRKYLKCPVAIWTTGGGLTWQ